MASTLEDMWPAEIRVDVRTPLAVLKNQAQFLERRTQQLVRALVAEEKGVQQVTIYFDVVAGAANRYRGRLMTVTHALEYVYPVVVKAECFEGNYQLLRELGSSGQASRRATSEEEFLKILGAIFSSTQAIGLIQSMVAKSNEAITDDAQGSAAGAGDDSSSLSGGTESEATKSE